MDKGRVISRQEMLGKAAESIALALDAQTVRDSIREAVPSSPAKTFVISALDARIAENFEAARQYKALVIAEKESDIGKLFIGGVVV